MGIIWAIFMSRNDPNSLITWQSLGYCDNPKPTSCPSCLPRDADDLKGKPEEEERSQAETGVLALCPLPSVAERCGRDRAERCGRDRALNAEGARSLLFQARSLHQGCQQRWELVKNTGSRATPRILSTIFIRSPRDFCAH